jgi:hypothetical protein
MRACQAPLASEGVPCDPSRKTGPDCDGTLFLWCNTVSKRCEKRKLANLAEPCSVVADGSGVVCRGGAACVRAKDPATGTRPTVGSCVADVGESMPCGASSADGPGCTASLRCVLDAPGATLGKCLGQDYAQCAAP